MTLLLGGLGEDLLLLLLLSSWVHSILSAELLTVKKGLWWSDDPGNSSEAQLGDSHQCSKASSSSRCRERGYLCRICSYRALEGWLLRQRDWILCRSNYSWRCQHTKRWQSKKNCKSTNNTYTNCSSPAKTQPLTLHVSAYICVCVATAASFSCGLLLFLSCCSFKTLSYIMQVDLELTT